LDEKELIQNLKSGSSFAFNALVTEYQEKVFNTCYGFLRNREDAEDTAQEVFIEVYFSIAEFRHDSKLKTWIYRIAVNKSLDHIRLRKRKKRFTRFEQFIGLGHKDVQNLSSAGSDPQSCIENNECAKMLLIAIEKLPVSQKVAFILHKYEDLSYAEISLVMDVSLPAVESLLHRAKNNLKNKLHKYYLGSL
jgi:RNA polymerase sigma-70 factor (ECF subfamily)